MAEAELRGVISGDASGFVAASGRARDALGRFVKQGEDANKKLANTFGGSGGRNTIFAGLTKNLGQIGTLAKTAGSALVTGFAAAVRTAKTVAIGLGAITTALVGIGGAAVASFARFEQSFSQVRTLVDESQVNIDRLADGVRDLSVAFGVDVVEATNAAYQAISAGQDPARVVEFLQTAFEGATAGAASTVDTVNLLTGALNTFEQQGLTAERASDVLFTTVRLGKTTITELAASFGQVGPITAAAGVSFEELGAALAATTAGGLSTAEAATAIRASINGIVNPSEQAAAALREIGVSAESLQEEGLVRTFERIAEATDGNVAALTEFIPNIRAVNAAAILAGSGLDEFREAAEATANASGSASEAFGKTANDITRQFNVLRQTLTDSFRTIGEALTPIVGALTRVFTTFASNTRSEVTALARVLESRLQQAEDALDDLNDTATTSGGAITVGLQAVARALDFVADGFDAISAPLAGIVSGFEFLARLVRANLLTALANLSTVFTGLLQIVTAIPRAIIALNAELARLAGFDTVANTLGDLSDTLSGFVQEAGAVSESLRESAAEAIGNAASFEALEERYDSVTSALGRASGAFRDASGDVQEFAAEVEQTTREVAAERAIDDLGQQLEDLGPRARAAGDAVGDLGDAAAAAGPQISGASTAAAGLSEALQRIAGDSVTAARGLADLGPAADDIARRITQIGTAQTDEQALAARQEAIRNLIAAADNELARAVAAARERGEQQLAEARAEVEAAQAAAQAAGGGEAGAEAQRRVVQAQQNLEAVVQRVNAAFNAERQAAQGVFDAVRQEIEGLSGSLEIFREQAIAKATEAGRRTIAEARTAFEAEEQRLREARARGEIQSEEFLRLVAENEQTLADTIARASETFEQARDRAQEAFDLGQQTQEVNALADALQGEFADAVRQAREDAEAFGFSQEELNDALLRIVDQARSAGGEFEALGEAAERAGGRIRGGIQDLQATGQSTAQVLQGIRDRAQELGLSAEQTQQALDTLTDLGIDRLREAGEELGLSIVDLVTGGFADLADSVTDLGERLDEDGRERLADLNEQLVEGQISVEDYGQSLLDLADDAELAGRQLRDLIQAIEEQAIAAEQAAARAATARNSFSRTGVGQRPGGETQSEVNRRFAGFSFGIQNNRPPTVQQVFESLTPAQRNDVREQARAAGVTNDQEFTEFVVRNSPGLDPGGLSFDLGGKVVADQVARLQAGERVLTAAQDDALGSLLSGFRGGSTSQQFVTVSPTFNIEGANAESLRETARNLMPEITLAAERGVTGKGLL